MTDIVVPTLGESVTEATVGKWLKSAGDAVAKDDVLVELETDKVAVEVSAEAAGTLSEIVASEGDTVEIGALLGRLGGANGASASAPAPKTEATPAPAAAPVASSGGASVDVTVPSMGESVAEGTIASFLKQVGEAVSKDETIAEIETDKVALEVPASADGIIAEWLVAEGDGVTPGAVLPGFLQVRAQAAHQHLHLQLQRQLLPPQGIARSRHRFAGSLRKPASILIVSRARAEMAAQQRPMPWLM